MKKFLPILFLSSCTLFQPKVEPKIEEPIRQDAAKDIVGEISAVVKSYNTDEEASYFKKTPKVKKERGILRYETRYTYKSKTINVLLEIVTFGDKISYTLNISALVTLDYSLNKKFEIKTADPDEVITQAANILNSI